LVIWNLLSEMVQWSFMLFLDEFFFATRLKFHCDKLIAQKIKYYLVSRNLLTSEMMVSWSLFLGEFILCNKTKNFIVIN
jgi:hypothetical protein